MSGLEIASKFAIGKLSLPTDPATFVAAGMSQGEVRESPLRLTHAYGVARLPVIHRDPFDRLLIAVAVAEGLTLLTDDQAVRDYPVPSIW